MNTHKHTSQPKDTTLTTSIYHPISFSFQPEAAGRFIGPLLTHALFNKSLLNVDMLIQYCVVSVVFFLVDF